MDSFIRQGEQHQVKGTREQTCMRYGDMRGGMEDPVTPRLNGDDWIQAYVTVQLTGVKEADMQLNDAKE